jgi:hypothetical protein
MALEESKQKLAKIIKDGYEKEYGKYIDIEDVNSALDYSLQRVSGFINNMLNSKFVKPIELNKTNEEL